MLEQKQKQFERKVTAIGLITIIPLSIFISECYTSVAERINSYFEESRPAAVEWFYRQPEPCPDEQKVLLESLIGMRSPDNTYLKLRDLEKK